MFFSSMASLETHAELTFLEKDIPQCPLFNKEKHNGSHLVVRDSLNAQVTVSYFETDTNAYSEKKAGRYYSSNF